MRQLGGQLDPRPRRRIVRGLGALTAAQQQQIVNAVDTLNATAGTTLDPTEVTTVVSLISKDGPLVNNAIAAAQSGNSAAAFSAVSTLVAGTIAVVNPIAGAVVGGVLAGADAALQALGILGNASTATTCAWQFPPAPQGVCFGPNNAGYQRPYGPVFYDANGVAQPDPLWLPFSTFAKAAPDAGWPTPGKSLVNNTTTVWIPGGASGAYWGWVSPDFMMVNGEGWIDGLNVNSQAPFGYKVLECAGAELLALKDIGPLASWWSWASSATSTAWSHPKTAIDGWAMSTPGLQAFALVYARAFQAALDYPINGYQFFGGYALAKFLSQAWNAKYPVGGATVAKSFNGSSKSLVDMAVAGYIDQWATQQGTLLNDPLVINDPPASALSTTSGAKAGVHPAAVISATAGTALVGAAATGFIAQQSIGAVFGNAFDATRKAIGIRWPWER